MPVIYTIDDVQMKAVWRIEMLALLLFCIINEVISIHFKEHNDMNRQFDKQNNFYLNDNIHGSVLEYTSDGKYNTSDDYRDDDYEREPRRILDWIKNMIKSNTSYKTTPRYEDVAKEKIRFREIEKNLTNILTELSSVLNQILTIVKYARQGDFRDLNEHLQHALDNNKHISKRNAVDEDIETNRTESDSVSEVSKNATAENKTQSTNESSGRRSLIETNVLVTTDEVKNKLFNYISEGFAEIKNQINSLKTVKHMFSTDMRYQIGYIVANIDTLNVNMNNLETEVAANKYIWSDNQILNLYDKIKMSNRAVSNLINVLKDYTDNSLNYQ